MKKGVLTGNQLKIIALITMTIDHIGKLIFPQYRVLRVIGRLAFPIFAFMIAEGCKYTKSSKSYLASIVTLAAVCQITLCVAEKSLHQNILVTFTLSIILILSIISTAIMEGSIVVFYAPDHSRAFLLLVSGLSISL